MHSFELHSDYIPQGDQGKAIDRIWGEMQLKNPHIVLMGVTGSGKTFTMANIIARANRPVLVISHNKTLAAQLYQEFNRFFPENAVEYFVSYYDYYQPEAFIPATNTYIAKESTINDEIDRMRLSATNSLFHRRDVIIVASVSCIYGIGSPKTYAAMSLNLETGQKISRRRLLNKFVDIQYQRAEDDFQRGTFRVRGDTVDVYPSYDNTAYRFTLEEGLISTITAIDPLLGTALQSMEKILIRPRTFFSTPREILDETVEAVKEELKERLGMLRREGKLVEAARLEERTLYDMEMVSEFGWCPGIENYSRYLSRRRPGEAPYTLLDYFPEDVLTIVDESHVTIPQIGGMYHGDRSRKQTLVQHGFRLPSALDNRPLNFEEYSARVRQTLFVSATPGPYEFKKGGGRFVEQIIRPTGLIDPEIEVRPVKGQIDDLMAEIVVRAEKNERTLVTTLTKKMSENLTRHYHELGLKVRYLHSDIDTLERIKILRNLRRGEFDALIGINLLREGLDLPEVSLVAILDADKEGFLRSETALIQTFGRAARNVNGRAILYADKVTPSMRRAMDETNRRRKIQQDYNTAHGITPQSISKQIEAVLSSVYEHDYVDFGRAAEDKELYLSPAERIKKIARLELQMKAAAADMEFEKAAEIRDRLRRLKKRDLEIVR